MDADSCRETLLDREWVLTNGTGSYAMGTAAGVNTRRYHGLLIAAVHPPVGRLMLLNQVLEELVLTKNGQEQVVQFSSLAFPDDHGQVVFAPGGHQLLRRFDRSLSVSWTYQWGPIQFTRELRLGWKRPAAMVSYRVRGLDASRDGTARLRLGPLLTMRDFHALRHRQDSEDIQTRATSTGARVQLGTVAATLTCPGAQFEPAGDWWYNVLYPLDARRGQEDREDHVLPGWFDVELDPDRTDRTIDLTVSSGDHPSEPVDSDARAAHLEPLRKGLSSASIAHEPRMEQLDRALAIAADDFVVDRTVGGQKLSTILAGYPWFSDWGRDTFIALPGLLLCTGRLEEAGDVLRAFSREIREGLVPNRFDDHDPSAAHYNTVDASLWFVHAALQFVRASGDQDAWAQWLGPAVTQIMDAYIQGTRFQIHAAADGLIAAGTPQTQLTWMDAACHVPDASGESRFVVFTPRHGKAVEINALWYNALVGLSSHLASFDPKTSSAYSSLANRVKRSFEIVFWNPVSRCLYDHVWTDDQGQDHADASIRPNQIFAGSLPHSPLSRTRQLQMLGAVRKHLLTPYGLRTLSPEDRNYHGQYAGPQASRDEAYHQGTVWPWLIGPYAEAVLRIGQFSPEARTEAQRVITPLVEMLAGRGEPASLGQLYEIHEGDPPHRPGGCMAQAWSIAEVLRVLHMIAET